MVGCQTGHIVVLGSWEWQRMMGQHPVEVDMGVVQTRSGGREARTLGSFFLVAKCQSQCHPVTVSPNAWQAG